MATGLLIFFWIFSSIFLFNRISFSVVTYQTKNNIQINKDSELRSNNIFSGEFVARDNNLGLIILDLNQYKKSKLDKESTVIFKFREKRKGDWSFQREYLSGLFDSQADFSFGFPVILNSKNKTYQFEIVQNKNRNNKIAFSKNHLITGYQYSKSEIVTAKPEIFKFFFNKVISSFTDIDFVVKSVTYLIPLVLVYVFLLMIIKNFHFVKRYTKILVLLLIIFEILFPHYIYVDSLFILIILWTWAVFIYKLKSKTSFLLSLFLILFWILIIPFGFKDLQDKLNIWIYALLVFGFLQMFIEERKEYEKKNL